MALRDFRSPVNGVEPFVSGAFVPTIRGEEGILLRIFGAGDEVRTRDPQLGKLMLYQLSYARIP